MNTEYHKKVIERLDELSKTLLDEYDLGSPNHRSKTRKVDAAVEAVNHEFLTRKDEILRSRRFDPLLRVNPDYERLSRLVQRVKSDPFIPREIRAKTVDLLSSRADVIIEVHVTQLELYCNELAKDKFKHGLEEASIVIHNRVVVELNKRECGIPEIEAEVHRLRLAIQEYFEEFHP